MQEEWSEDSLGSSKRSSVALSSNSTPTYIRKTYAPPETLTQRSPSMCLKETQPSQSSLQCPPFRSGERIKGYWIRCCREAGTRKAQHAASQRERELLQLQVHTVWLCVEELSCHHPYIFWRRDSYSQDLAETGSEDSESKPTKLVSVVTQVYTYVHRRVYILTTVVDPLL